MKYRPDHGTIAGLLVIIVVAIAVFLLVLGLRAHAAGWSDNPKAQEWFQSAPVHTCCAQSDGFLADEYVRVRPGEGGHTEGGVIAHITDDDSDPPCWEWTDDEEGTSGTTCRRKVPQQRDYFVPESSIVYQPPNPTGHGVLFLNNGDGTPRCYFLPSGA